MFLHKRPVGTSNSTAKFVIANGVEVSFLALLAGLVRPISSVRVAMVKPW